MSSHQASALYGLIGYPLGHSFSKAFFTEKFEREHINAEYLNFELPDIGDLMEVLSEYPQLRGFNVTIPYKQQVLNYLAAIDPVAEAIGAVNVVKVTQTSSGPQLSGFNSDVVGFTESLRQMLNPEATRGLVLGNGGAAKAVVYGLRSLGIEPTIVSRTPARGQLGYDQLTPEVMRSHTVIVNTTPLGMSPNIDTCPPIPYSLLTPDHVCFDLVYNPLETKFMRLAAEQGATVKNGLEMLHLQAIEAWEIWNK